MTVLYSISRQLRTPIHKFTFDTTPLGDLTLAPKHAFASRCGKGDFMTFNNLVRCLLYSCWVPALLAQFAGTSGLYWYPAPIQNRRVGCPVTVTITQYIQQRCPYHPNRL